MSKISVRPTPLPLIPALRWLPASAQARVSGFLQKCGALAMILAGGWLVLALVSHNGADPSMNTVINTGDVAVGGADAALTTAAPAQIFNLMGPTGAYFSDALMQVLGYASIFVACSIASWGWSWWRTGAARLTPGRIILMLLGTLMMATALSALPFLGQPAKGIYGGGAVGILLARPLLDALAPLGEGLASVSVATPLALIGFIMWGWVSLLRWQHAMWLWGGVTLFCNRVGHLFEAVFAPAKPKPERRRSLEADDELWADDGSDDENADDGDDGLTATKQPQPKSKPPVVSRPQKIQHKPQAPQQLSIPDPSDWELPHIDLLKPLPPKIGEEQVDEVALRRNADMLQAVLSDYNVRGNITSIHPGPVVTLYELEPAPGTKSARVINLSDDIARSMSAVSVRSAVVPGRNVIGVEIPNKKRQTVFFREMLDMDVPNSSQIRLPLVLGKDIGGEPIVADLARMPHLLVAGTTGSGKSVAVNTMILSLLYRLTPDQCRFIMIDPKMLELSVYDDIPHLLSPVVTEPGRAVVALKWVVREMENRYRAMSKLGVRNIDGYNARLRDAKKAGEVLMRKVQTGFDIDTGKPVYEDQPLDLTELPYIVVVVDEFADLMLVAGKDVEASIQRLAQMARAAGIHLIMATQRPSVDVITGVIKANFPTRISFQVTSKIDSRTILGEGGAEQLLGMGDMLYMAAGGKITRVHGPFVADQDVESVVKFLRAQGEPSYIDGVTDDMDGGDGGGDYGGMGGFGEGGGSGDELYDRAVALVARERKASTSFIQRHLQIGYNRAATLIEKMEKEGVVGPANHVGKREVLIGDHSDF
jgi:S-DNA-T family DNA segregation ATPase FtsK/SpoIIIE